LYHKKGKKKKKKKTCINNNKPPSNQFPLGDGLVVEEEFYEPEQKSKAIHFLFFRSVVDAVYYISPRRLL
jgi:hypothetical protein